MTDTKQNIHAQNEHSSYCECIWCVEKATRTARAADHTKSEIELEMTAMLKDLPLPITIQREADLQEYEYIWQCMGTTGKAYSFVDATRQALQSVIAVAR